MRFVTWNCNGALRKKFSMLQSMQADVFIIQECEDPSHVQCSSYHDWARNYLWVGPNKNRGLGIFARSGITLEASPLDLGALELFLPCRVNDSINLVGVWSRQANSPTFKYIGQVWKFLQKNSCFLESGDSILIGDFNSNSCWDVWDRWWNHSDVVRHLSLIGLESAYHVLRNEVQGGEQEPTFFMYRKPNKPYHIDYAFISNSLLDGASCEVGRPDDWLAASDHMPVLVEIPERNEIPPV